MKYYIEILRIDHWFKNIFMIAGVLAGLIYSKDARQWALIPNVMLGVFATCIIASANYVINEILDAAYDKNHPTKCNRPIPSGQVNIKIAYIEYVSVGLLGLLLASTLGTHFFWSAAAFLTMGIIYNVRPIRSKDVVFIDVLTESLNNPIRLLLGWYVLGIKTFPPSSLVIAYWMFGAFCMGAKRLAEYLQIGRDKAINYRKSFRYYDEHRLIASLVSYASGFMFFFAVIIIKYHVELILIAPLLMFYMGYYVKMTYETNSIVQTPELLLRKPGFILLNVLLVAFMVYLTTVSIPIIHKIVGIN